MSKLFSLSSNVQIIFSINQIVVASLKCQKVAKNAHQSFPELMVASSNVLFCPINRPKPKDNQFVKIENRKKENPHTERTSTFLAYLLEKWQKRLINYRLIVSSLHSLSTFQSLCYGLSVSCLVLKNYWCLIPIPIYGWYSWLFFWGATWITSTSQNFILNSTQDLTTFPKTPSRSHWFRIKCAWNYRQL